MGNIIAYIKVGAAGLGALLGGFLGGWDIALQVLLTLTVLDYITGVLAGIYTKSLSSSIGYRGLIKKVGIYVMVAVSCLLDQMFGTQVLRLSMISFYIATEGISILENWGRMELPLPDFIKKVLLQLKDKSSEGDDKNETNTNTNH